MLAQPSWDVSTMTIAFLSFPTVMCGCPAAGRYAPGVLEVQLAVQRLIKRSGAQVYFAGAF